MVPIPPPPLQAPKPSWTPPSDPAGGPERPSAPLAAGQIDKPWRWVLQLGWVLIVITMFAVGGGSQQIGKPTWWMDLQVAIAVPFILPVAAVVLAMRNAKRAVLAGWLATVSLAATAVLDIRPSPGAALIEGGLALSGLLVSTAAIAGRVRSAANDGARSDLRNDA